MYRPSFFNTRTPVILQNEVTECGAACLAMVLSHHGHLIDMLNLRKYMSITIKGTSLATISQTAQNFNLTARGLQLPLENLSMLQLPAILHWDLNHFVVMTAISKNKVTIHDPARGKRILPMSEVSKHFTGIAMELTPNINFKKTDEREKISLFKLMDLSKDFRLTMFQILLLSFCLEVFTIASPFFLQMVVDRVIISKDYDLLTILGVGFLILAIMQIAITALRSWVGVFLSTNISLRLNTSLFSHMLHLPLVWFEKRTIGDILSRYQSLNAIQLALTSSLIEVFVDGIMTVVTLSIMFYYSPLLTIIILFGVFLYALTRIYFYQRQKENTDEHLTQSAKLSTYFIETLRGVMAVKLGIKEEDRLNAYYNLAIEQTNANVKTQSVAISQKTINGLIFAIESIITIWIGANLILSGGFTVGMLYAYLSFKTTAITRLNNLIDKFNEFRMLELHSERVADIALAVSEKEQINIMAPEIANANLNLICQDISYAYGSEAPIFDKLNLEINRGEFCAVVGPSGVGKTTLLKVLLGLLTPSSGSIVINSLNIKNWDLSTWRRKVSAVMQEDQLFFGSVAENISFFDQNFDMAKVKACAALANLDEEISKMPMNYETIIGSLGTALSGGQKQRVLLARALYRNPEVIFIDESFDQLDVPLANKIIKTLLDKQIALVVVTHRHETISQAHKVFELKKPEKK